MQREEPKDLERSKNEIISVKLNTPIVQTEKPMLKRALLEDEDDEVETSMPPKKDTKLDKTITMKGDPKSAASKPAALDEADVPWICPGIYVKIMNKSLNAGAYYKAKGNDAPY